MAEREDKGIVCVTGGTGYVASWLIMRLLQHGFSVRATVRSDPKCKRDISYLTNLPKAEKELQVFHADLNQPESFTSAIEGCIGVFHLAHPMDVDGKEPEDTVTKRAVEGTLGILKACLKSKTVKRVIYTSSAATILYNDKSLSVTDESTWSDLDICRNVELVSSSYLVSKIMTEKTALEFAEKNGLDLVTLVLPVVVAWALHLPDYTVLRVPCTGYGFGMHAGNRELYECLTAYSYMVHVDDVARALLFLLDYPNARGRYICSSVEVPIHRLYEFLSTGYPEFQIPKTEHFHGFPSNRHSNLSSTKLLDTGFKFKYGLDGMFDGAIQCCEQKGFL